jgi:hypothetical protein
MEDLEASKRQTDSDESSGWIACTTDSILAMKDTLWDMLITLPPDHSANAREKVWPVVECPRGRPVKATQRDLRRFNALRGGLARLVSADVGVAPDEPLEADTSVTKMTTDRLRRIVVGSGSGSGTEDTVDKLVEPSSWSALAYSGFMWWASAGEQPRSELQEESARDAALLADLGAFPQPLPMAMPRSPSRPTEPLPESLAELAKSRGADKDEARLELAIIAYFHRLTTQMLSTVSDIVDSAEEPYADEEEEPAGEGATLLGDADDGDAAAAVTIDSRSMERMGLDVWSAADVVFVQELTKTYFGRPAHVEGKGVEVCGVRVC